MHWWQNLFQSQDSQYFLKTSLRLSLIPLATMALMAYSLAVFMDMNYHFFVSRGLSASEEIRWAFVENLFAQQLENLPWVGVFMVFVMFMGFFMAHLVLRPFNRVAQMCKDALEGIAPDAHLEAMTKRQLVVRASLCLIHYLQQVDEDGETDYQIPADLEAIRAPIFDKVFYFQYALCTFILWGTTAAAIMFSLNDLHLDIAQTAVGLLKSDQEMGSFLMAQHASVNFIALCCAVFSFGLYAFFAHHFVRDVDGASYAYLRDIRDVVSGDHTRRMRPRWADPGKCAAQAINGLLDHVFPAAVRGDVLAFRPHVQRDAPPHFVEELRTADGSRLYRVVAPNGEVVEGLSQEDLQEWLKGR